MAVTVLPKLGAFTGESGYGEAAQHALQSIQPALRSAPLGFAQWLVALDFALGHPKEIAIMGTPDEGRRLLDVVFREYRPNRVVAVGRPGEASPIPLLEGRTQLNGRATAYVCHDFTCQLPVTEPDALAGQLET